MSAERPRGDFVIFLPSADHPDRLMSRHDDGRSPGSRARGSSPSRDAATPLFPVARSERPSPPTVAGAASDSRNLLKVSHTEFPVMPLRAPSLASLVDESLLCQCAVKCALIDRVPDRANNVPNPPNARLTPAPPPLQDAFGDGSPGGEEEGTRCGVPIRDQVRGCPRNCRRRAWARHKPLGNREGRAATAMTCEPGDLPSPSSPCS